MGLETGPSARHPSVAEVASASRRAHDESSRKLHAAEESYQREMQEELRKTRICASSRKKHRGGREAG